ncbi:hypothetical protein [Thalassotalea sp. ND16A]|uniref:hypothetical protein n=1 Tax=Thalassotalea sp. ND16A TaxID=1535422 RepID=UPI00126A519C|nr:hypothetical protein [Thalassotalea sp. ND16A]
MRQAQTSQPVKQTNRAGIGSSIGTNLSKSGMLTVGFVACLAVSTLSPLTTAFAKTNALSAETNKAATAENLVRVSKGMAIYQYYQGNNFAALTQLAINHKKAIVDLSGNSELFKAGLQLHFQMDMAADDIFSQEQLQQANVSGNLPYRDLVYLSFAKALYKKQHYQQAKQALALMGNHLAAQHQDDYHFLNAQLLLKFGDINGASAAQQQIGAASVYHRYLAFNQAMLLIANEQTEQAISALAKVTQIQPPVRSKADGDEEQAVIEIVITDELEALLDRANLALAYLSLEQGQNRQAIDAFKRVRLDGIDSEAAMLGYGWAAANSDDYQTALMVWQQLSSHELLTPYVLEAYLAIGYAYQQLHDSKSAYAAYHLAITKFNQQQQLLTAELANIYGSPAGNEDGIDDTQSVSNASNDYILSLLQPVKAKVTTTTAGLSKPSPGNLIGEQVGLVLPPTINTFAVVASNEFQQQLDDLNSVNASITLLNDWQQQLTQLADKFYGEKPPAATRETSVTAVTTATFTATSPLSQADESQLRAAQLAELASNYQASNAKLNQLASVMVGKLFKADPVLGQRQQLQHSYSQYQRLSRKLAEQQQHDNYPALKARLDRLAGLLLWQIGDYYLDNDGQRAKLFANNAALKLQQSQQLGLSPVTDMQYNVANKLAVASSLQQRLLSNLQTSLAQSLAEQRHGLATYLEKAKTAIVQLNDEVFINQQHIDELRQPISSDAEPANEYDEGANDES